MFTKGDRIIVNIVYRRGFDEKDNKTHYGEIPHVRE
jgi:hypothetical protein